MLPLATCFSRYSSHVLTCCAGLLLSGCQEKTPTSAQTPPVVAARPPAPSTPAPARAKSATTACNLVDDTVAEDPFGAEITVADLVNDDAMTVSRKPVRNRHERNQVDTILTLRHQDNQFEFYRTPDKDLLREVTITNFQPTYGRQLQQKLSAAYRARYARATGHCDSLRIGDTNRLNTVAMTVRNGTVSAVQVEYYVD